MEDEVGNQLLASIKHNLTDTRLLSDIADEQKKALHQLGWQSAQLALFLSVLPEFEVSPFMLAQSTEQDKAQSESESESIDHIKVSLICRTGSLEKYNNSMGQSLLLLLLTNI